MSSTGLAAWNRHDPSMGGFQAEKQTDLCR